MQSLMGFAPAWTRAAILGMSLGSSETVLCWHGGGVRRGAASSRESLGWVDFVLDYLQMPEESVRDVISWPLVQIFPGSDYLSLDGSDSKVPDWLPYPVN